MTHQGNGKPMIYRITVPGPVSASLKTEQHRASQDGKGEAFLSAVRYAVARIHHAPFGLGEAIFPLRHTKMIVHLAFLPPLVLEFAIHQELPSVFLRRVKYSPSL